jgi:collagenase-like PrtC family protease
VVTNGFPLGTAALHPDWVEARFNVPGVFSHQPLIIQLEGMMALGFGCHLPIETIHGAPAVVWNGGRAMQTSYNPDEFKEFLRFLAFRQMGCFPTFTNHLIGQNDLADPAGNGILEQLSQRPDLHGVIVNSEMLSKHIAEKHPKLRQVASIIKVAMEQGRGKADYYRQLGERFYRYVVHPDDCRDLKLLEKLDREKAEIIVNENCVADCPRRVEHYGAYAKWQKAGSLPEQQAVRQEINQIVATCHSPLHVNRMPEHQRSCNLSRAEVKAAYDLGFRHFKLQGRADDPYTCAYDLVRFMLEPDVVGPLVYKATCRWLATAFVKKTA